MNRKERRRQEKQAQKQAQKQVRKGDKQPSPVTAQAAPSDVSNALFNYATNTSLTENEPTLDWELQQISNQLKSGFTGEALKSCQKLEVHYPNNSEIQLLAGTAYFINQEWDAAVQCFEMVLEQDPNNAQAFNYLGDLAIERTDLAQAENYFRRALALVPQDQATGQRLAYVLQRQDKMAEAVEIYRVLVKMAPDSAEIHLNYGYALFRTEQVNEAITAYRTAIKLNSELGLAHINLGMALSELDQDEDAITAFRQGLLKLPSHVDGLFGLARCLRAEDEYAEAAEVFKKALKLAPDHTAVYWELGYSLELSGDKAGGQKAYEKCLEHHPDHSVARHLLDALTGNTTETAPPDYVAELFDDYAESFDDSLVNQLNYVVPNLLKAALDGLNLEQPRQAVLDLGGGTGLVAAEIKDHLVADSGVIHGVDLSAGMIEIAEQNNRYDETYVSDIAEFLANSELGLPQYDLIIAGDVFVYIGNLERVFAGVYQRLEQAGLYLFTVEQSPEQNYHLQSSGRYAHSEKYLTALAQKFDFEMMSIKPIIPRKEGEQEIDGYLVCLKKR